MERKIYNIIRSICFIVLFTLPICLLVLTTFRTGVVDLVTYESICSSVSIPFISTALNDLAELFNITTNNIIIIFFTYYISCFLYYLCIEILLILLECIHYLYHYFEKRVLR